MDERLLENHAQIQSVPLLSSTLVLSSNLHHLLDHIAEEVREEIVCSGELVATTEEERAEGFLEYILTCAECVCVYGQLR